MITGEQQSARGLPLISLLLWIAAVLGYAGYWLWGQALVEDAYAQRSFAVFNDALAGRSNYPVEYYLNKAESLVRCLAVPAEAAASTSATAQHKQAENA